MRYSGLIRELAVTDFKLKYQGSVLGYLWSFAKPLLLFLVLLLVFTKFIRLGGDVPHYPLYLLIGIVLWTYFVDATSTAMVAIVERADLIRKVYFPRIVIVLASSATALITVALNLLIVVAFLIAAQIDVAPRWLLVVPLLIELYVLALGCSLLLAALYVRFRDFRHIWEVALQVLFYASPIIYPLDLVPASLRHIMSLNPIVQIVQDFRQAVLPSDVLQPAEVLGATPWLAVPYLAPWLLLALGIAYFGASSGRLAEEL